MPTFISATLTKTGVIIVTRENGLVKVALIPIARFTGDTKMSAKSPKYMIFIRLGRDNFNRDGFTDEFTKDLFDSHTEDKATEVKVLRWDTSECVAHSKRGKIIQNSFSD